MIQSAVFDGIKPNSSRKPAILWSGLAAFGAGMAARALTGGDLLEGDLMLVGSELLMNKAGDQGLISRPVFFLGVSAWAIGSAVSNYMAGNPLGAINGAVVGMVYGARSLGATLRRTSAEQVVDAPLDSAPRRPRVS